MSWSNLAKSRQISLESNEDLYQQYSKIKDLEFHSELKIDIFIFLHYLQNYLTNMQKLELVFRHSCNVEIIK